MGDAMPIATGQAAPAGGVPHGAGASILRVGVMRRPTMGSHGAPPIGRRRLGQDMTRRQIGQERRARPCGQAPRRLAQTSTRRLIRSGEPVRGRGAGLYPH
jgi:hypothetical protein